MPQEYTLIDQLEDIIRYWSKKAPVIRDWHWWDHIRMLYFNSVQHRIEHYSIIYRRFGRQSIKHGGHMDQQWQEDHDGSFSYRYTDQEAK